MLTTVSSFKPGVMFPAISLSGSKCSLNCSFCRGRFLNGMIKVEDPFRLRKVLLRLALSGVNGVLISGGFNKDGYLNIEPYLPVVKWFKRTFNVIVSVHIGLAPKSILDKLVEAEVDVVDYEFTLDRVYIKELRGLKREPIDYVYTLDEALSRGLYVTPHIPLGFTNNFNWVYEAINLLVERRVDNVVFLMNMYCPPNTWIQEFRETISYARWRFSGEISLGCMRPMWFKKSLDRELVEKGLIDRIVNPHFPTTEVYEYCCSVPKYALRKMG